MAQCSDLFFSVFRSGSGGCLRTCSCGRVHFDGSSENEWTWGDGGKELATLRMKATAEPDRYYEQDGAITTMNPNGEEIVYGCTCGRARKYEEFLQDEAERIADYLNGRVAELEAEASKMRVKK